MKTYNLVIIGLLLCFSSLLSTPAVAVDTSSVSPVLVIGGLVGSGDSEFNEPDSLYVDASGTIFAGDSTNLRVQVFSSSGSYLREITGFTPATGDAAGNEVQGIGELSDGTLVVVEKVGNLYFFNKATGVETNKVDLTTLLTLTNWDTQGLVVDSGTDNIYITNQPEQKILVIAKNGSLVDEITLAANATPENMVIDTAKDRIYVSTEGFARIDYYWLNGTNIGNFGGSDADGNFEGLALDPLGNIIAVSEGPDSSSSSIPARIIVFDATNFTALYSWGSTGHTSEGEFLSPDGIAYDYLNNRVLIADQGNARIQIFDYLAILKSSGIHSDTTPPTVSDVADFTFEEGTSTVQTIDWNVKDSDVFGGSYNVTKDTESDSTGTYGVEGKDVTVTVTDLAIGSYTYELSTVDAFGNTASDSVTITVTEAVTSSETSSTSTTSSSTKDSNGNDSPYPFIWSTAFIALIPLVRKKIKNY